MTCQNPLHIPLSQFFGNFKLVIGLGCAVTRAATRVCTTNRDPCSVFFPKPTRFQLGVRATHLRDVSLPLKSFSPPPPRWMARRPGSCHISTYVFSSGAPEVGRVLDAHWLVDPESSILPWPMNWCQIGLEDQTLTCSSGLNCFGGFCLRDSYYAI